jgi:hypothetical protein
MIKQAYLSKPARWSTSLAMLSLALSAATASAAVQVTVGHVAGEVATSSFTFANIPAPAKNDAASSAKFSVVAGERDPNSGEPSVLCDGRLPSSEDEPDANFFFNAGTEGGRLALDLGRVVEIRQVNTYSWHPSSRGPQVYTLYASAGGENFNPRPGKGVDPTTCGWKKVTTVDTRPQAGGGGGQYGVSIADSDGTLGTFQYLLFDISRTESEDMFGNTFYSEIDVVEKAGSAPLAASAPLFSIPTADGSSQIVFDTAAAPELKDWAEQTLAPVLAAWFPKIVAMLPSENYSAPKQFRITLRPGDGVAYASGTSITANSKWLKGELKREAVGALLHETVHVVQYCGYGQRRNPGRRRTPGWLVEGIPDYIRWFKFEPQSHGADILWLQDRPNTNLKYDAKYRVTANFINYVVEHHDSNHRLIARLSAACGTGTYTDEFWKEVTDKSLTELNDEWVDAVKGELEARAKSGMNILTTDQRRAGWRLLFNGVDFAGWHNFKRDGVRPGWQVKDGALVCVDPHDAGDIVTADEFSAFELELDYNISEGGNSGIMFHVTDEGGTVWATGPEFQLEDNAKATDKQRCGWLYALYQPPDDPATGKPLDSTRPAGEWNHVRLVISPEKCEHWINGVKYFEYVLGSDDFKARVAKSKFGKMPHFAKAERGYISLQGDHGQVSFRNIRIRPIRAGVAMGTAVTPN